MPFPVNVRIVLVGPESPGNIGAAARAMKTMGLSRLYLVSPACDPRAEDTTWLAHNAGDVLEQARIVPTLSEALAGTVLSVATTQRARRQNAPFYTPEELAPLLLERAVAHDVALVFGRESSGLTNEEHALCAVQSTIPAATDVPSLNLAQAVMVYAYALFRAAQAGQPVGFAWNPATHEELEQFYTHLADVLTHVGARPATTMENYVARFRRVLGRVPLESRDVKLLHNLLGTVERGPAS